MFLPSFASRCIELAYTELFVKLVVQTGLIRVPVGSPVRYELVKCDCYSLLGLVCTKLVPKTPAQAMCINLTASLTNYKPLFALLA